MPHIKILYGICTSLGILIVDIVINLARIIIQRQSLKHHSMLISMSHTYNNVNMQLQLRLGSNLMRYKK